MAKSNNIDDFYLKHSFDDEYINNILLDKFNKEPSNTDIQNLLCNIIKLHLFTSFETIDNIYLTVLKTSEKNPGLKDFVYNISNEISNLAFLFGEKNSLNSFKELEGANLNKEKEIVVKKLNLFDMNPSDLELQQYINDIVMYKTYTQKDILHEIYCSIKRTMIENDWLEKFGNQIIKKIKEIGYNFDDTDGTVSLSGIYSDDA